MSNTAICFRYLRISEHRRYRSMGLLSLVAATGAASSAFAATSPTQLIGSSAVPVQIVDENGGCLDVANGIARDGAPLQIWECNSTGRNQTWYMNSAGIIHFGGDPRYCIDLPGGTTTNQTPLQLWTCNDGSNDNRAWSYNGNIQKVGSLNKCIEPRSGSSANGTVVQIFDCNGTSGQRWSGRLLVTPRTFGASGSPPVQLMDANGGCLDLPNGDTTNGTKLQIYTCDKFAVNQRWYMDTAGAIHYGPDPNKCIDLPDGNPVNNARIQLWTCDNGASGNQVWTYNDDNTIRKKSSPNKCIELLGGSSADGNKVQLYDCNGSTGQQWSRLLGTPNMPVYLANVNGGCLQLPDGNTSNGTKLRMTECSPTAQSQKWYVDRIGAIHYAAQPGKCVDRPNGTVADKTQLQVWDCDNGASGNQKWTFEGDGTIQSNGACIESWRGSSENGTAVQVLGCDSSRRQKWMTRTDAKGIPPFSPYACPSRIIQPYDLKFGVDERSAVPIDPLKIFTPGSRNYDNRINHLRYIATNQYVNAISLSFNTFDVEHGNDSLSVGASVLTGVLAPNEQIWNSTAGTFQAAPLRMTFQTGTTGTRRGVDIGTIGLFCDARLTNSSYAELPAFSSVDGVLLAPNDVVYMSFPAPSSNQHASLALWASNPDSATTTADMDVYVACGKKPIPGDYAFASRTFTNNEFIHLKTPCRDRWHVAVHSSPNGGNGRAVFRLLYSMHLATEDVLYRARISPLSTQNPALERENAHAFLHEQSKRIYAATDGQVLVDWELYLEQSETASCGGYGCNVILGAEGDGGQALLHGNSLSLGHSLWNGHGQITHEFGHARLGLPENYGNLNEFTVLPSTWPTSSRSFLYNVCGHSEMANGSLQTDRFCTTYNHMYDPRYVSVANETWVLLRNGGLSKDTPGVGAYDDPVWVLKTTRPRVYYPQSYTPIEHSSYWDNRSDFKIAKDNGHFVYSPDTLTEDPYNFLDFETTAFPGTVVDK